MSADQHPKTVAFLTELAALCEKHGLSLGTMTGEELVVGDANPHTAREILLMRDETMAGLEHRFKTKLT